MRPAAVAPGGAQRCSAHRRGVRRSDPGLAARGMVEITRDIDTDIVRVGLTEAGWHALEERS